MSVMEQTEDQLKAQNRRLKASLAAWKLMHDLQVSYHIKWKTRTAKLLRNARMRLNYYKARVLELEAACMYVEGGPDAAQKKE